MINYESLYKEGTLIGTPRDMKLSKSAPKLYDMLRLVQDVLNNMSEDSRYERVELISRIDTLLEEVCE